ncbi:hypothetical protein [Plantactinospora sp. KLBMP9567]|uniref:alpha/beta fold hydrolase n=1 Tax=Plantactinospora sp. KLBMP9567 TaxID=3085900 RepID=UPI0029818614|nr:hypothetical protein [Plantactinospora sp. KLBMP9567]MDW5328419.1 hypothetical protein [Plantactinospora sp. KLBMP9567]
MSPTSTPILLLHGSWHAAWCWNEVIAHLGPYHRPTLAVDMVGHGLRARRPECLTVRPFAPEALATEVSPVADVDLGQTTDLLVFHKPEVGHRPPTIRRPTGNPRAVRLGAGTRSREERSSHLTGLVIGPAGEVDLATAALLPARVPPTRLVRRVPMAVRYFCGAGSGADRHGGADAV